MKLISKLRPGLPCWLIAVYLQTLFSTINVNIKQFLSISDWEIIIFIVSKWDFSRIILLTNCVIYVLQCLVWEG